MAAAQSELVEFDGEQFRIGEELVAAPPTRTPVRTRALQLLAVVAALYLRVALPLLLAAVAALVALVGGITVGNLISRTFAERVSAYLVPLAMAGVGKRFNKVRKELLKQLQGKVLDLGCGGGAYFRYAAGKPITTYVAVEPNQKMHPKIRAAAAEAGLQCPLDVRGGFLDDIKGEEGTYDAIILGNVLCEVFHVEETLGQLEKLLKPNTGRIYFSEHVLDDDQTWRRILQRVVAPWWVTFSNGCNCDRQTLHMMRHRFGANSVRSWKFYAGTFPWTARFEIGLVAPGRQ